MNIMFGSNKSLRALAAAVAGFLVVTLPVWLGTVWPLFSNQTIPEWLSDRNWPIATKGPFPWLIASLGFVLAVLLSINLWTSSQLQSGTENRKAAIDRMLNQFGVFRSMRTATLEELSGQVIRDRIVFLSDVPRGPNHSAFIEGKRFEGCVIVGPTMIFPDQGLELHGNTFAAPEGNISAVMLELTPKTKVLVGAIAVRSTAFIKCTFYDIAFCGPHDRINYIATRLGSELTKYSSF